MISINLLTFNAEKYIEKSLKSIFSQTYPSIEFLIIDNNSQDRTIEKAKSLLKNCPFPWRIICNKENLGFSAAHNRGIRETKGEFVLCLNQDVILSKDFINNAVKIFSQDKKIGSVQAKLYKINNCQSNRIIDSAGLLMLKNRRIINRGQGEEDKGQYNKQEEIFGVDGAAAIYRRKALEDVKIPLNSYNKSAAASQYEYFDEDFFLYKEDVDLAWRMRLYGWKAIYAPQVIAWHVRGAGESAAKHPWLILRERRKISQFSKYFSFKNQRLMQIKNEIPILFFKHLPWILFKEIAAWFYVLFFEKYTIRAVGELLRQSTSAWRKRKIIMSRKRVDIKEISKWFSLA